MTAVEFIEPLTHGEGVSQAAELLVDTYGATPEGVWAAPDRVNLIDEHTDYSAGLCLPIALPHHTFIALGPRKDTKIRIVSDVTPDKVAEADLDGLKACGVDGWPTYPTGVAWALRQVGFDRVKGSDAAFVSCVPLGSDLSLSVAMTCSTVLALDNTYGLGYGDSGADRVTLISAAIKSENEMTGVSANGLDQNASIRCTVGHTLLLGYRPGLTPLENVSQQEFDLDRYSPELLVVDIRAPYRLDGDQYAQYRTVCEEAAKVLDVVNLHVTADGTSKVDDQFQAPKETSDALPNEIMKKRVRHVVTEIERVHSSVRAFAQGDTKAAGRLLDTFHDSLAADYEVTVPGLNTAVDVAHKNGVYSARITDGGFSDSIIALVDKGCSQEVTQKIVGEFEKQGSYASRAFAAYTVKSASCET